MSSSKKTILLVDSNRTFALYLGILLKRMGFSVCTAENGREALECVKPNPPDMIIMDADMPGNGGLDTLAAVKRNAETAEVPVVMLSAGGGREDAARMCVDAGCDGFLPKPVPMDELHELLQDFVFSSTGFRRRHMRVNARLKVMVMKDGAARELPTESVSEGGLYVRTDEPYPVGTEVEVALPAKKRPLRLKGSVIYVRGRYDDKIPVPSGMAVEFTDVSTADTATLARLVRELMTQDMAENEGGRMIAMPRWSGRGLGGSSDAG